MNRRDALARLTAITGAVAIGADALDKAKAQADGPHYFRLMKELTLIGYFTSEIGCTKALRYVEAPGHFDGDVPYKKGDQAFYNPSRRLGFG